MNNETEILEASSDITGMMLYQQDKANIDSAIATANAYPRNIKRCLEDAITIATLSKESSEECIYELPVGGVTINGPSVKLAMIAAQQWGNLRVESRHSATDATTVTARAVCFDLEKNITFAVEAKRSIVGRAGRYKESVINTTIAAVMSIATRNAILRVIPGHIIDAIYNAAVRNLTGDLSTEEKLIASRSALIKEFVETFGVSEKELLAFLKKPTVQSIDAKTITTLTILLKKLQESEVTVDSVFRPEKDEPPATTETKEAERMLLLIGKCTKLDKLKEYEKSLKTPEERLAYDAKFNELSVKK